MIVTTFSGLWDGSEGRWELFEHGADRDGTPTPRCEWGGSPIPGYSSRASMLLEWHSLVMAFLKMKCTYEMCFVLSRVKNLHVLLNFSK